MNTSESLSQIEFLLENNLQGILRVLERCRDSKELMKLPEFLRHREDINRVAQTVVCNREFGRQRRVKDAVRVVHWNIERGRCLDDIMKALTHHRYLSLADVLIVTETDIGMARSGNRHVAEEIASELGFQYLYVNSYLCLSKGTRQELHADGENKLGLHGITLFSRLPIHSWKVIPLPSWLDIMRGSEKRLGTKRALVALLSYDESRTLAVAGVHLEAKSSPSQRQRQMQTVLHGIKDFVPADVPVILGGDLNTSTYSTFNKKGFVPNSLIHLIRGIKKTIEVDYLHPDLFYEKLFADVQRHGFDYKSYNALGQGTLVYDQNHPEDRQKILEHLPPFFFRLLCKTLKPWGGRTTVKIDWFLGKGLNVLRDREINCYPYQSQSPLVLHDVHVPGGERLSDHLPIGVDVAFP